MTTKTKAQILEEYNALKAENDELKAQLERLQSAKPVVDRRRRERRATGRL